MKSYFPHETLANAVYGGNMCVGESLCVFFVADWIHLLLVSHSADALCMAMFMLFL